MRLTGAGSARPPQNNASQSTPFSEKNIVWNSPAEYLLYMDRMFKNGSNGRYLLIPLTIFLFSGCVYFNTFFMAKKKFNQAEKSQRENAEKQSEQEIGRQGDTPGRSGQSQERPSPRGQSRQPGPSDSSGRLTTRANAQERALYDDVIKKASKVLTFHPDSKWADDALWLIGKSYYNMGDYSAADRKFKELVTNYPESKFADDAYYHMGMCQMELLNEELALETFQRLEREFGKSGYIDEAHFARGRMAFRNEEYDEAIELLAAYLEKYSGEDSAAVVAFIMGQCYQELGDYQAAFAKYKIVERYNPSRQLRFEAILASGSVLLRTDSTAAGMKILDDLARDERYFAQSARIRLKIAEGFQLQNELQKSISEYETTIEKNPKTAESAEACYRLGLIYQNELFDIEKAKEFFGKLQGESSSSQFRNQALARSAQIAKFEAYRVQLQKADSVRTSKETLPIDTAGFSGSIESARPDSAGADSSLLEQADVGGSEEIDDFAEIVIGPDTAIAGDTLYSENPDADRSGLPEKPDSADVIVDGDSIITVAENDFYTVSDSGSVKTNSLIARDSLGMADPDSGSAEIIDEQAVLDSIEAVIAESKAREDSIRQAIIEEGVRTRFLLAELYAYELNQPDSALNEYLLIVEQYPTSPLASKSLLAAASLKLNEGDSVTARTYLQSLFDDYPSSPQAALAAEIIDYPLDLSGNAIGLYALAESLLFKANNPDSAAAVFGIIADNFPDLAPQAAFARARAIDLASDGADSSAYFAYQVVTEIYPQTVYAEKARERLGQSARSGGKRPPPREDRREQNRPQNLPDTSHALADILPPAPPVKVLGEFVYPQSLLDRRLKGEVLFKIKINLFGKVEEHEIIGPSGEYAIDSSATAALLETEFDTSNYDFSRLESYFRYVIQFERPDINIFNDPYREERRDPY